MICKISLDKTEKVRYNIGNVKIKMAMAALTESRQAGLSKPAIIS